MFAVSWFIFVALGVVALVTMLHTLGAQGKGCSIQSPPDRQEMQRHIIWKSFYVNPQDPRGCVPKTWGVGQTVNFRTKLSAGIFTEILVLALLSALGLVYTVLFR
jgi:uncharacterized membrane protein